MAEAEDDVYSRVRKIKFKRKGREANKVCNNLKSGQTGGEFCDQNSNEEDPAGQLKGSGLSLPRAEQSRKEKKNKGEGRIIASSTTVQGFHTKFQQELKVGDYIEIEHPNTLIKERRQVANIISERTLILEREFSCDLVSTSEYYYISVEDDDDGLVSLNKGNTYSFRERDGMFKYKTVVKSMDSKLSREDVLDIRAKKQRDKYCWI